MVGKRKRKATKKRHYGWVPAGELTGDRGVAEKKKHLEWPFGRRKKGPQDVYAIDPETGRRKKVGVYIPPSPGRVVKRGKLKYARVGVSDRRAVHDMAGRAVPFDVTARYRRGATFPPAWRVFEGKKYRLALSLARTTKPPKRIPKYHTPRIKRLLSDKDVSVRSVIDPEEQERHVYVRHKGRSKLWRKRKK